MAVILDFAGVAGGERVPPSPLGWYLYAILFQYCILHCYSIVTYNVEIVKLKLPLTDK